MADKGSRINGALRSYALDPIIRAWPVLAAVGVFVFWAAPRLETPEQTMKRTEGQIAPLQARITNVEDTVEKTVEALQDVAFSAQETSRSMVALQGSLTALQREVLDLRADFREFRNDMKK